MSKIKELKKKQDYNFNFVEALEMFCPDKKSKYTDMLLRMMLNTKNLDLMAEEVKKTLTKEFEFMKKSDFDNFSDIAILNLYRFYDSFFNFDDLKNFRKFCEYNERGIIEQNDLSRYKNFDQILNQLSIADMKLDVKGLENQILKVYEDDQWLLLRPLTYVSSKKYGSNTKWCTTSDSNPEYFFKYAKKGVLIYCINKKTGYKVASFYSLDKNDPEFSFWNQIDIKVDSLDTELTEELRTIIRNVSKDSGAKTNRFYLSEDLRKKEDDWFEKTLLKTERPMVEPIHENEVAVDVMRERTRRAIMRETENDAVSQQTDLFSDPDGGYNA